MSKIKHNVLVKQLLTEIYFSENNHSSYVSYLIWKSLWLLIAKTDEWESLC